MIGFIHHIANTIKAEYVIAHRTGASAFDLVLVPKQTLPSMTTSIVQFTVCQYTQQR